MKKNLISVVILALVFANFVLTALLMFSVLPETKKANTLIEKVCSAIDLDLNSGAATGTSNISIDDQEIYKEFYKFIQSRPELISQRNIMAERTMARKKQKEKLRVFSRFCNISNNE